MNYIFTFFSFLWNIFRCFCLWGCLWQNKSVLARLYAWCFPQWYSDYKNYWTELSWNFGLFVCQCLYLKPFNVIKHLNKIKLYLTLVFGWIFWALWLITNWQINSCSPNKSCANISMYCGFVMPVLWSH